MAPLSREQLASRRERRRAHHRRRHRRILVRAAVPLAALGAAAALTLLAVATLDRSTQEPGGIAPPVPPVGVPRPPQAVILASSQAIDLRLPIDRTQITAIVFRAVDNPDAVALEPSPGLNAEVAPRGGVSGSATASVDIGARAGTAVYAPVSGIVRAVTPYRIAGRVAGYELLIDPESAADRSVRINHLEALEGARPLRIRQTVRAGETLIGQVRDFSRIADQALSKYTADSGNHVHIEVVRKPIGGLLP